MEKAQLYLNRERWGRSLPGQWNFLASISPISTAELEHAILRTSGGRHPLDVAFTGTGENESRPWMRAKADARRIQGTQPESLRLVLAMPISWKGTLQQYAGRLHREHGDKKDVRIYDYVEEDQPQLARMWDKRRRGYAAMGYRIKADSI